MDTDDEPRSSDQEKEKTKESRWKRPTLYITIAAIYLLLLSTILSSVVGYYSYNVGIFPAAMTADILAVLEYIPNLVKNPSIVAWMTFFITGGPFLWVIPSVIGAILLLRGKKKGVPISLAASVLLVASSIAASLFLVLTPEGLLLAIPMLASSSITFLFLIIGWRRVRWR